MAAILEPGLGVLLLAALTVLGTRDLQDANALKNLLASVVTSIAVVVFILGGAVAWPATVVVLVGCMLGGWLGARWAQRISAPLLRKAVVAIGALLTIHFFVQSYA